MKKKLPWWIAVPVVCVLAGLLLAAVHAGTADRIAQGRTEAENAALKALLPEAEAFDPADGESALDALYEGKDASGEAVG